jgi:hypothetical protein
LPAASDIRVVDLWRRDDAKVAADAVALWTRLGALPAGLDPGLRARELCTAAYRDGELIGVSTMVLDILPQLRAAWEASPARATSTATIGARSRA